MNYTTLSKETIETVREEKNIITKDELIQKRDSLIYQLSKVNLMIKSMDEFE